MTGQPPRTFWDDLAADLEDPEFRAAYVEAAKEIALKSGYEELADYWDATRSARKAIRDRDARSSE